MRTLAAALALLAASPPVLLAQGACPAGPVALVLSGGGAKGVAHIGALHVLDSVGFRPDMVVGTSMGSIVGALYASGIRGAALDSIPRTLPLAQAFRGYAPEPPQTFIDRPALLVWSEHDGSLQLEASAADEASVNAMLTGLYLEANLRAAGDFDRLPIPFRAVATDLRGDSAVVLGRGDLARATRASMSIPVVFTPVTEERLVLVDGGMVANLPIAAARKLGARRVIAIDVGTRTVVDSMTFTSPLALTGRLVDLLSLQPVDSLGPADVYLRPAIDQVSTLDFRPAALDSLQELGARAARTALAELTCPLPTGPWREPAALPPRIASVDIQGLSPKSAERTEELLGIAPGSSIDVDSLALRLRRLQEREELASVWLRPTPGEGGLALAPLVAPPPRRRAVLGLAYDSDIGGRIWVGLVNRSLLGTGFEGSASLAVGGLGAEAEVGLRRQFARRGIAPTLSASLERERVEFFADDGSGAAARLDVVTRWATAFVGLEYPWSRGWLVSVGAEPQVWEEPDTPTVGTVAAVARLRHVRSPGDRAVVIELLQSHHFSRASADISVHLSRGEWRIRPRVRAVGGHALPLYLTTPLGGWDGFPGLPIGDMRGDREFFGSLALTHGLVGPLQFTLEGATGRQRLLVDFTDSSDEWIFGTRLLAGFDTPIGPVEFGWGVNSLDLDRWMLRVGRWF